MAQLLHSTPFTSPNPASNPFSVTIPSTAAGAKLVCIAGGGAVVTAKLGVGGTSFTKRASAVETLEVAIQDIVDSGGGTTTIQISLNGAENIHGVIYEFASGSLGNFISSAGTGNGHVAADTQMQISTGSLTTAAASVLFSMFAVPDTNSTASRQFWGFEPLGKQYANQYVQNDPAKTKFWSLVGVSDQSAAGTFTARSSRIGGGNYQCLAAAYQDLSGGTPTYTNPYANAIEAENSLPGSYYTAWFGVANNANIAGYTDAMSYAAGDTVNFKVDSANVGFTITIYRIGFYGYFQFGAKFKATVTGTPAVQTAPSIDSRGGTVCAWSTTATWSIPSTATPGVYIGLMRRTDNSAFVAQCAFVVRSPVPGSQVNKVMIATSDFTWQAYNAWGATNDSGATGYTGRNIYSQAPATSLSGRAFSVSYDRPFGTVDYNPLSYFWESEVGFVNFLEGNGYDLAYFSSVDLDKDSTIPSKFKIATSVGHSEYWSDGLRDAYENGRDAGTNLMFLSSNTSLWRVRFAAGDANRRTMICYKDSHDTAGYDGTTKYDPVSYTGTWRDARTVAGGVNNTVRRPESGMTGQWFIGNGTVSDRISVPNTYKSLPMWRNTRVATGGTITLRGTASNTITTAGTTVTIAQPTGTLAGELVIIGLVFNGNPASLSTDVCRLVRRTDGANQTTVLLQCYAPSDSPVTYTITWAGSLLAAATAVSYTGAVWEDIDSSLKLDTGGTAQHTTRSIPSSGTGRWAVTLFADTDTGGSSKTTSWTAGSGLTSRVTANTSAAASGPWSSLALMDTAGAVSVGNHQYSATAQFANAQAAAGIMYISPGTILANQTLGAELDYIKAEEPTTPTNMVRLSAQPFPLVSKSTNYAGAVYTLSGIYTMGMTLYKAASGALVFNVGSWRYPFGISRFRGNNFDVNGVIDTAMQQSMINLIKDMGVSPATLMGTTANNDATALVSPGTAATATDYGLTITSTSYQSIFAPTTFPATLSTSDGTDYSLGTVFTADVAGQVNGARWYFPGTLPDAPVIATLYTWDSDTTGTQLAQVTFPGGCQTGWNQVLFSSPVTITANTKYVISVWTSDSFARTTSLFASAGVTNGSLTAPQNTGSVHNGKFKNLTGGAAYPDNNLSSTGYFADVLFTGTGNVSFVGWGIPIH